MWKWNQIYFMQKYGKNVLLWFSIIIIKLLS